MAEKSKRTWMDYWRSANQLAIIFGVGFANAIVGPSLGDLAEIYSTTPDKVAAMSSARALGVFIGSCIGGSFYRRMNDQILMMLTLAVYAAMTTTTPFLSNTTYLYGFACCSGLSIGVSNIGSQVRLVRIWAEQSASALQAFHMSFHAGSTVASFVCAPFLSLTENGLTVKETQIHIPYVALGIALLLILTSMIAIYCIDPSGIDDPSKQDKGSNPPPRKGLEIILMVILFIYIFLCMSEETAISTLVSNYAINRPGLHFSKPAAAYLAGLFWVTSTIGLVLAVFASISVSTELQLVVSHLLSIGAAGLLLAFGSSAACTWIGVGLLGLGIAALYGAASGLVFQYLHVRHIHISVLLTATCAGIAGTSYFLPPIVEAEPIYLQHYIGGVAILHLLVLVAMFLAIRGKQTIHAAEGQPEENATPSVA